MKDSWNEGKGTGVSAAGGALWLASLCITAAAGCVDADDPPGSPEVASPPTTTVGATGALRDSLGSSLDPVSAAIARANAQADVDLHLVARVAVQPGELLELYEPSPGQLVVSGAGAPARAILSQGAIAGMGVEDVWRLAAGSAGMPDALHAALGRARLRAQASPAPSSPIALHGSATEPASSAGAGSKLRAAAPLSTGWCDNGYYTSGYGDCQSGWDFEVCLDNWWNGAYATVGGAFWVYTNVCPATGPVVLRVTSDHDGGGIWTVSQNTVRWWQQDDVSCLFDCLDDRVDVQQASGDRFQFRFWAAD